MYMIDFAVVKTVYLIANLTASLLVTCTAVVRAGCCMSRRSAAPQEPAR